MSISVINITLDVTDESIQTSINVKQNDTSRKLKIQLTDGGVPAALDPNDMFAVLMVRKPDGEEILNRCELRADGVIIYDLTLQTTAAIGQNLCEVRVYDTTAYETITSARFMMHVREAVYADDVPASASEYTALTEALVAAENIDLTAEVSQDGTYTDVSFTDKEGNTTNISTINKVRTHSVVYANDGDGNLTGIPYRDSTVANTVAYRGTGGRLKVGTPSDNKDAATKEYVDSGLDLKADASSIYTKSQTYSKAEVNTELAKKLDLTGGTLEGTLDMDMHPIFNILTAYDSDSYMATNVEYVQEKLAGKANTSDVYTKSQTDAKLAQKANTDNVYTKSDADAKFAEESRVTSEISLINEELAAKADADDTTAALEGKADKISSGSKVYATTNRGEQTSLSYDINATGYTVAYRGAGGRLLVGTPSQNNDAATKKYVDDKIADSAYTKAETDTLLDGKVAGIVKQYTSLHYYYNGANLEAADTTFFNTNTAPIVIFTVNCEGYQSSSEERIITLMRGSNGSSSSAYVGFFAENENGSTEITYVIIKDGTIELKRDL